MITFTVPGQPVAKGRPRITTINGKARAFTPGKTRAYEAEIAVAGSTAMAGARPYTGALAVEAVAVFSIPSSWPKKKQRAAYWHTIRPDADNIAKALGDGLNGVCWTDDSQVASLRILKVYGASPGLRVTVTAIAPAIEGASI